MTDSYGFGIRPQSWHFSDGLPSEHRAYIYEESLPDIGNGHPRRDCLHRADALHYVSFAANVYHVHILD